MDLHRYPATLGLDSQAEFAPSIDTNHEGCAMALMSDRHNEFPHGFAVPQEANYEQHFSTHHVRHAISQFQPYDYDVVDDPG